VLFGAIDNPSAPLLLITVPEILWEASLTIWLIVKGFKPSPITSGYDRDVAVKAAPSPA